jgi:hypothetical protein
VSRRRDESISSTLGNTGYNDTRATMSHATLRRRDRGFVPGPAGRSTSASTNHRLERLLV